uniref:CUB domain-containing protein n=1 Tax=Panagrolaimus davidi TaxID=227884 RepID=A0A914P921_9BILA
MEALTLSTTSNDSCHCGCEIFHHKGFVIASKQFQCKNKTLFWIFPRQEYTKLHLQILKHNEGTEDLLRILHLQPKEIAWSSEKSKSTTLELSLDTEVYIIFEQHKILSPSKLLQQNPSFFIDFSITKDTSKLISISREYSAQLGLSWAFGHCTSNSCQNTVILVLVVAVALVIISLIALPPLLCTYATQKYQQKKRQQNGSQASEALLTSLSQRLDAEMFRSGETDMTRLTAGNSIDSSPPNNAHPPYSVAKRSIGIQLSVQSTPRTARSPARISSINSLEDFEYDYYDPVERSEVPGSLLRPFLVSDIDIDSIINRETSGWLTSPPRTTTVEKNDSATQVDSV